ncbi:hypothetical protein B4123_1577 [Bacillus paralicheniformis]|nr:hypothetical protein B4123_1577 [Bacillus paralicheniformis]TWJ62147.1 hypothetical protein CHCC5021_1614 [Bacillus paralicheniformis]TWJ69948.1 hypothetical protein CHCC5019_2473 [Bacillus paralicheniformis]TWJ78462.1 hypothetical protein CHCC20497_2470 [Bacillus paralicheniformis]TWL09611.1 hypothetical protein CHCC19468_1822 [Bacillus paralicheniformis]
MPFLSPLMSDIIDTSLLKYRIQKSNFIHFNKPYLFLITVI